MIIENRSAVDANKLLERKLHAAMKYAHDVCILGAGNLIEDIKRTGAWVFTHEFHYHPSGRYERAASSSGSEDMYACNMTYNQKTDAMEKEVYRWYYRVDKIAESMFNRTDNYLVPYDFESPIHDEQLINSPDVKKIFGACLRALSTRAGSCGAQSFLVTKFLWEHPDGIKRIEGVSMKDFDHAFVVVNREGELSKPETWGDAWIIDAWANGGMIYRPSDVLQKIAETKAFCIKQIHEQRWLGLLNPIPDDSTMNVWEQAWEIKPDIHHYPSYSKHKHVEDYYRLQDYRYGDQTEEDVLKAYEKKFRPCRKEIESLRTNSKWAGFFENKLDASQQNLHDSATRKKVKFK